jgi:chitinase
MAPLHASSKRTRAALATTAAAALAVGGAVFAGQAQAASTNILTNGSFGTGDLTGWSCDSGTASVVTSPVYTGDTHALAGAATGSDDAQCTQTVSVQPNTSYTLSGEFEGDYVYLGVTGGTDTWTPAASTWSQLSTTFTTGGSQTSVTVYTHGWYGQGTYYADDLALTGPAGNGGGSPSASPSTTTASPSTPPTTSSPSSSPTQTTSSPSASPTSTGTSGGGGNSGLPAHSLVGYLHTSFSNGSGNVDIESAQAAWNVIALAFADSNGAGDITFTPCPASQCAGAETQAQLIAGIKTAQSQGRKVLISIGGANGQVTLNSASDATEFVNTVSSIVDTYGLNGVDLDFENQSLVLNDGDNDFMHPTTPAVVNLISAVQQLKAKYGSGFIVAMAPQTFFVQTGYEYYGGNSTGASDRRAGSWLPVIYGLRNQLNLLDVQEYNSGPVMALDGQYYNTGGEDFLTAMTDMLLHGFTVAGTGETFPALSPSQVTIGLPANQNAGNGAVSSTDLDSALGCLTKATNCGTYKPRGTYPGLGGLMAWSINWDVFGGNVFANTFTGYFG